ncbi:DUF948 domain-containing protein [Lapidilactobacillus luobeiensis]|uniref:DUF948 domain-containing protein n=1 Tax=Lapidilactobacillus luobeiensis TaxID=2950371 RepID=UPI0021C28DC9|nr:DUF948 domain-containing protein [Lapidilactobacillus luobeiensis]
MSGGEIAGLIAAGAFLILVIFTAVFLNRLSKVMKNVEKTVDSVDQSLKTVTKDVNTLSSEVEGLLVKSNTLLGDVNQKVATMDPVFQAMGDLGESVSDLNAASRQLVVKITNAGGTVAKVSVGRRVLSSLLSHKKED